MRIPFFVILALGQIRSTSASVYTWNIGWVNRNPDTLHSRPVISINGQWPPPTLKVSVGEQVTLHLINQLVNETTSIHFHGLFQNGTNEMDGPVGVAQCPVGPGETFTHVFQVSIRAIRSRHGPVRLTTVSRSISQAHIGITPTIGVNILMGT